MTKPQLPDLQQTVANTTLTSFEQESSHASVTSIKFTKQELVSDSVSDKQCQCNDWIKIMHILLEKIPFNQFPGLEEFN